MAAIELYSTTLYSDANLKAYWRLENTNDSKGSYNLTNSGTTPFNAAVFNNGADFGSSNSTKYLSYAGSVLGADTSFSFVVWFKLNQKPGAGVKYYFIRDTYGSDTHVDRNLRYYNTGSGYQLIFQASAGYITQTPQYEYSVDIATGGWHHTAMTYNISNNTVTGYLDGSSVGSNNTARGSQSTLATATYIGTQSSGGDYSNMIIDDLAVFNRVLTPTEISNLYTGNWPSIKSFNGLAKASVKSVNGLAIASVKNYNGLA